jgi:hypothetical protein
MPARKKRRYKMAKGGRYGKYGEQKRFERLRQKKKGLLKKNVDFQKKKKKKG